MSWRTFNVCSECVWHSVKLWTFAHGAAVHGAAVRALHQNGVLLLSRTETKKHRSKSLRIGSSSVFICTILNCSRCHVRLTRLLPTVVIKSYSQGPGKRHYILFWDFKLRKKVKSLSKASTSPVLYIISLCAEAGPGSKFRLTLAEVYTPAVPVHLLFLNYGRQNPRSFLHC